MSFYIKRFTIKRLRNLSWKRYTHITVKRAPPQKLIGTDEYIVSFPCTDSYYWCDETRSVSKTICLSLVPYRPSSRVWSRDKRTLIPKDSYCWFEYFPACSPQQWADTQSKIEWWQRAHLLGAAVTLCTRRTKLDATSGSFLIKKTNKKGTEKLDCETIIMSCNDMQPIHLAQAGAYVLWKTNNETFFF